MKIPASNHFTPIDLTEHFNSKRQILDGDLRGVERFYPEADPLYGVQNLCGIPFAMGAENTPNVLLLDEAAMQIPCAETRATYILFLHAVEDRISNYQEGFADFNIDGNELGDHVSDYVLHYADGSQATTKILRRFAIQQSRVQWGASAFAAIPARGDVVNQTASEMGELARLNEGSYGWGETRTSSARDSASENLWIYALPNPHPDQPIASITVQPQTERSLIYAISTTSLIDHPLRPGVRRKVKLMLPQGVTLNQIGEVEQIDIDLGVVISARAALAYDNHAWLGATADVQPQRSETAVIVEYSAHPQAKLYVATADKSMAVYTLADLSPDGLVDVAPAHRPVRVRVTEKGGNQPVAVRLHMHGAAGEYLPPKNQHRRVNPYWFEDNYGEFVNSHNQYCYIPGTCEVDLPLGTVYVEIRRGYEIAPIRTRVEITPETDELTFELDRVLHWRERGWVTADTHVHFLSPQTALLEGSAEGVNVVNLLASQWGEMFSNVTDFDGRTTIGAKEFGGDGEFLVRVGTENRMQVLGHISLLGYSGHMINPLCTGGPSESALGDPQEVTMAEWAERCIAQGGLTIMPHGPNPQCERAADIVLGLIHGMEMMTFNPHDSQINPYGIADWYRYLNLGYQVPVVGGSDKMAASSLLGGVRTYTQMGDLPFTYENWMTATKAGNTFVTVGPLAEISVDGVQPGGTLQMTASGGTVAVEWTVESACLPIDQVEIVVGGVVHEQINVDHELSARGTSSVPIARSTWIALRVRGHYTNSRGNIAAHTSAVQVVVDGAELFSPADALTVLEQIEGAIAYVDTIAPRPAAQRYKALRATLERAHNRLHQRMHQQDIYHQHTVLHNHEQQHEH